MTKITVAIVAAAAVGSAEAWGRSYPTRKPTAPRGFAGNSKSLKEFGGSAHRHGKIGKCKGDCDYDYQCARGLKCFQQNWRYTTITGCEGRTKSNYDYCYDPTPTARPTRRPTTAMPTRKPTTAAHLNAKTLTDHGFSAHTLKNVVKAKGLGMCQGDCDSDTHCQGSMKCFHSSSSGNTVTGCEGKTAGYTDYCFQPKPKTPPPTRKPTAKPTERAVTYKNDFGTCTDIGPGATSPVFKFMYSCKTMKLSKCSGYDKNGAVAKRDCCKCGGTAGHQVHNANGAHLDTKSLTTHGYDAHKLSNVVKHNGLGMCQGDCDSDAQCRGSMACYHSSTNGKSLKIQTGCEGKTEGAHDYCYQPNRKSSPERCLEWTCAEWCMYFDESTEAAGVYAKNGCVDDGADDCKCK